MIRKIYLSLIVLFVISTGNNAQFALENAYPNLSFTNPVFLAHSGDGTNRVFVIEQAGKIKVFPNSHATSSTKDFLNITDRGVIKEGNYADITIFDYENIEDTAVFKNSISKPKGIEYVIVNGKVVIDKGNITEERPGNILLKAD